MNVSSFNRLRGNHAVRAGVLACMSAIPCVAHAQTDLTGSSRLLGDRTEITAGAAAVATPEYAGAERARVQFNPVLVVQRGVLFFDTSAAAACNSRASPVSTYRNRCITTWDGCKATATGGRARACWPAWAMCLAR